MGYAAAQAHIEKAAYDSISGKLGNTGKAIKNIRESMDIKPAILNIDKNTFAINIKNTGDNTTKQELDYQYHIFIDLIKHSLGTSRIFESLEKASLILTKEGLQEYLCILILSGERASLIGNTTNDIRTTLTAVVKHPQLVDTSFGTGKRIKVDPETGEVLSVSKARISILEIGHTGFNTPLIEKLNSVISGSDDSVLRTSLNSVINRLGTVQSELKYTFLNTSNNTFLGKAVLEVIQPYNLNAKFAKLETALYNEAVRAVAYSLKLENVPGSNTLIQDGIQFGIDKVVSGITGVTRNNIKKHPVVVGKIKLPKISPKVTATSYKTPVVGVSTPIRTTKGNFYSLASLQQLINDSLQNVISANMGSGSSSSTLNYQTGRFAASVNVERMSQSREGMITAFYSYMKNPYQTFEPGYAQGSPKTRDPKLLIAKSIREIAATKVGNRLRAVSV